MLFHLGWFYRFFSGPFYPSILLSCFPFLFAVSSLPFLVSSFPFLVSSLPFLVSPDFCWMISVFGAWVFFWCLISFCFWCLILGEGWFLRVV